ncbi:MAG TPA: hypothetical protein GX506_08590 [Firmicutes bacterium]|nr:hypothetical protein [Bacillota bacterium]
MEPLITRSDVKGRILLDLVRQVEERIREVQVIEDSHYAKPKAVVRREESFWLDTEPWEGMPLSETMARAGGKLDPPAVSGAMMALLSVMKAFHDAEVILGAATPDCIAVLPPTPGSLSDTETGPSHCRVRDPKIHHLLAPYRGLTSKENNYMPPEVIQGQPWSEQQDIFAAGVTFYYLLTGVLPFDDSEPSLVADNILHKDPPDPRVYNPAISERLASLVLRMLNKRTEDRPRSAGELLVELNELAASGSLKASPGEIEAFKRKAGRAHAREKAFRAKRFLRYRWGWIAGAVAVVLLGVILFQKQPATPTITTATPPEQVVKLYYQAIDNLDVQLLDEAIDPKAGADVIRWVTNLYVIHKVNVAMSLQAPKGLTGGDGTAAPGTAPPQADGQQGGPPNGAGEPGSDIVKIKELEITRLPSGGESLRFKANYLLVLPSERGEATSLCEDILTLSRVNNKWRIVQVDSRKTRP